MSWNAKGAKGGIMVPLGHIYAEITVRPLAGSNKSWKGLVLVDTGATGPFLPRRAAQARHPSLRAAFL